MKTVKYFILIVLLISGSFVSCRSSGTRQSQSVTWYPSLIVWSPNEEWVAIEEANIVLEESGNPRFLDYRIRVVNTISKIQKDFYLDGFMPLWLEAV